MLAKSGPISEELNFNLQARTTDSDIGRSLSPYVKRCPDLQSTITIPSVHTVVPAVDYYSIQRRYTVIMPSADQKPRTLYDKVFQDHIVDEREDGTILLYIGGPLPRTAFLRTQSNDLGRQTSSS